MSGHIYAKLGFVAVFSTGLGAYMAGATYATFFVEESKIADKDESSKPTKRNVENMPDKNFTKLICHFHSRRLFDLENIKSSFRSAFREQCYFRNVVANDTYYLEYWQN